LKAKGLVSELRKSVNIKDTFTRINKEREIEREKRIQKNQNRIQKEKQKCQV